VKELSVMRKCLNVLGMKVAKFHKSCRNLFLTRKEEAEGMQKDLSQENLEILK